jgi:hypothetical protein
MNATFIQSLITAAADKAELRALIISAIGDLATFMRDLDAQLAAAPVNYAAADPDYAAYLAALPLPAIPGAV